MHPFTVNYTWVNRNILQFTGKSDNGGKRTIYYNHGRLQCKSGKIGRGIFTVEKYELGSQNRNGDMLANFAPRNNLRIANIFFDKKPGVKRTWRAFHFTTKNEIDHILTNNQSTIQDGSVLAGFKFPCDHRLCRAKLKIPKRYKFITQNQKITSL